MANMPREAEVKMINPAVISMITAKRKGLSTLQFKLNMLKNYNKEKSPLGDWLTKEVSDVFKAANED